MVYAVGTDHEFGELVPRGPEAEFWQLGISPEMLGSLASEDARMVVSSILRSLERVLHPDPDGTGSALTDIDGWTMGDVSRMRAEVLKMDDEAFADSLHRYSEGGLEEARRREVLELREAKATLETVNTHLGGTVLDLLTSTELEATRFSGHMLIDASDVSPNTTGYSIYESIDVTVHDGVVKEAVQLTPRGMLVKQLPAELQAIVHEYRSDVESPAQLVYIGDDSLDPAQRGWYSLVTAVGRVDASKKELAVRFYDKSNADAFDVPELELARILGYAEFEEAYKGVSSAHPNIKSLMRGVAERILGSTALVPLSEDEIRRLASGNAVHAYTERPQATAEHSIVFYKPKSSGGRGYFYVTRNIQAMDTTSG